MVGPGAERCGGVRVRTAMKHQVQEAIREVKGGTTETHEAEMSPLKEAKESHPDT